MAPLGSSSHMKRNRGWPGVPNRYSSRSSESVMRPKSMATVVMVFVATLDASSTPRLSVVIAASVVSGAISEIDPTKVVLPTPNPPATTILTGMGPLRGCSEGADAIENPFQQVQPRTVVVRDVRTVHLDPAFARHVGHEDAGHAEGDLEPGRDLGHRDGDGAQIGDRPPLPRERRRG